MTKPRARIGLVFVVVVASVATAGVAPVLAGENATSCENVARHDAFRLDQDTVNASANGSATSQVLNTEVTVEQAPGFVRIDATNPNGYCVRFVVTLDQQVVAPATLGTVEAANSSYEAEWRAVHDFNRSETYTKVTFVLPAATEGVTFAPAKARVAALKWTGAATNATDGWFGVGVDINPFAKEKDLRQRTYTFSPDNGTDIITVPLENRAGNRSIHEYQAVYKTPDSGWRPVGTETSAPVFKRTIGGGKAVQFQFNDPDATVKFTANPTPIEEASHEWTEYWSGWDRLDEFFGGQDNSDSNQDDSDGGWLPFAATPVVEVT